MLLLSDERRLATSANSEVSLVLVRLKSPVVHFCFVSDKLVDQRLRIVTTLHVDEFCFVLRDK